MRFATAARRSPRLVPRAVLTVAVAIAATSSCRDSVSPLSQLPSTLDLRADTIELTYIGEERAIEATTRRGNTTVASPIAWSVSDRNVAVARQDGSIVARGPGVARVYAIADSGGIDSAVVRVRQRIDRIVVDPKSRSRPMQRTWQYTATAFDAGGAPIENVTFAWSSTAPGVADISTTGLARAIAVGSTTIRATAGGISGEGTLTVTPLPFLRVSLDTIEVGVGQYPSGFTRPQPIVIADSLDPEENIIATVTMGDPSIATVISPVNVPIRITTHQPLTVTGVRAGVTQLTVCAPLYQCGTTTVRVSTPRFVNYNGPIPPAGSGTWQLALGQDASLGFSATDSLGNTHHLATLVVVAAVSSDTGVLRVLSPSQTIPVGNVGVFVGVQPVAPGTAFVVITAPGYRPDTVRVEVVSSRLRFHSINGSALTVMTLGVGQHFGALWGPAFSPSTWPPSGGLTFTVTQKHPEWLRLSATSISVPVPRSPGGQLDLHGLAVGTDTITVSAPGVESATLVVHVTTPTFTVSGLPTEGYATASPVGFSVNVADSLGNWHFTASPPSIVRVTSSDPAVMRPRSELVEIPASTGGGFALLDYVAPGTATLTFSDPNGFARPFTTAPITLRRTNIAFSVNGRRTTEMRTGQRQGLLAGEPARLAVVLEHYLSSSSLVTLRSRNPAIARPGPTETVVAPTSGASAFFDVQGGDVVGSTWFVAEGPGLIADSVAVTVTRPAIALQSGPEQNGLTVELRDGFGNLRATTETLTFQVSSSDSTVLVPDQPTVTVPAGSWGATLTYSPQKAGTAVIRVTDPRTADYRYQPGASDILRITVIP